MLLFYFLENVDASTDFNPPSSFWIGMGILLAILFIPWIVLLVYALTVKYRVRVFNQGHLIATYKFKANEEIKIDLPSRQGYEVEGLYRDDTFMLPLEYHQMPKKNLKIYIKWKKINEE